MTTSTLRTAAAAAAGRTDEPSAVRGAIAAGIDPALVADTDTRPARDEPEALEMPDLGESPADFDQVPVVVAWMRVMREVREIRKEGRYSGGGTSYNFRGVDQAMNIFGAAIRKHGVIVMPSHVDSSYRDTKTTKGNAVRECTVIVTYTIYGPKGDSITAMSAGESLDSADKGTAKAMSVALRVLLLQGGMVPTENRDPDADRHERGEAEVRSAASYREEILDPGTSRGRLRQIYNELGRTRQRDAMVLDAAGEEVAIGELITKLGHERPEEAPAQ